MSEHATKPPSRKVFDRIAIVRDIAYVIFGKYGQYLITFITLPLIARLLGTEGVGLLAIGMSAFFVGSLALDMGITTFLAARVRDADVNQVRGNYLAVRLAILSVLALILVASLAFNGHPHLQMIALGLFAGGVSSMGDDWVLMGQSRFGILVIYTSIGRILYLILIVSVLPIYRDATVAIVCLMVSSIPQLLLTWRLTTRELGRPERPRNTGEILRLGAPVFTSRMLENTYEQGSAVVFSAALSAHSLGLFSASDRPTQAASSMLDAIGFGLLPRLAGRRNEGDFWRRGVQALAITFVISLCAAIALCLIAPWAVPLVFGDAFTSAVPLLQVEAFVLPGTAVASFVTTAILPVCRDTRGVLYGSAIGTGVILVALGLAFTNGSVWNLVWGILIAETTVATFYLFRMAHIARREDHEPPEAVKTLVGEQL